MKHKYEDDKFCCSYCEDQVPVEYSTYIGESKYGSVLICGFCVDMLDDSDNKDAFKERCGVIIDEAC